ncbi:hypothetical protein HN51_058572 [Arachis hypogaea]
MVACKMTHDEKNRSGGPKIWFLPPRVSEQALSFFYPPSEVVMNHSTYLSDVSSLSKIYVPIKDIFKHWYLLCVDVKKRKLICIDPMQQRPRKTIRERQIRQLANFIDWMIHEHLADERLVGKLELDEVAYQLGEFQIYYPQNLPQQDNSFDSGMWVARWQLYAETRNSFIIPPVDESTRMRLALDLVLKDRVYEKFGLFIMPCLPAEAEKLEIDLHVAHRRSVISTFVPFGVVEFDNDEAVQEVVCYGIIRFWLISYYELWSHASAAGSIDEIEIALATITEPPVAQLRKVVKENLKKKKGHHQKSDEKMEENKEVVHKEVVQTDHVQENVKSHVKDEDKEVVKNPTEKHNLEARPVKRRETAITRTVKFIFGEDIRWAQLPVNCSLTMIRDTIKDRFPQLKSVLVKYKD